jgi:acetyl esterase
VTENPVKDRKPIDPALRRYLDETAPPASDPASPPPTEQARIEFGRALMRRALESRTEIAGLPNGVETRDLAISETLTGRLYMPPRAGPASPPPVLVYLHGGGWVVGSVETHDPFCRLLSEAAGVIILSVEYRLAPEHPFPAGLEDALTAFRWAARHAATLGADPERLALGGDSAGANLAAAAANRLCANAEAAALRALMLLYPVTDHPTGGHASYVENATGYGLEANLMRWLWAQYAPQVSPDDPDISPLRLSPPPALPPTLVATAEYDPLRDEGIAYAEKLAASGVAVSRLHAPDMHHNYPVHPGTVARFPQAQAALTDFARWLTATLDHR